MGAYVYKLNGKTIKAFNGCKYDNEVIEIAIASFYTKPWSRQWDWFSALSQYDDSYDKWMTSIERAEMRERELFSAGIYKNEYSTDDKEYWQMKRKMKKAKAYMQAMIDRGVKYVAFGEFPRDEVYKEYTVYELGEGFWWSDEPTYGTPEVGTIHRLAVGHNIDGSRIQFTFVKQFKKE